MNMTRLVGSRSAWVIALLQTTDEVKILQYFNRETNQYTIAVRRKKARSMNKMFFPNFLRLQQIIQAKEIL